MKMSKQEQVDARIRRRLLEFWRIFPPPGSCVVGESLVLIDRKGEVAAVTRKRRARNRKCAVVLATTLSGCAMTSPPVTQVRYICPPGYDLGSDYLCWPVAPPPASYAAENDDPPPPPEPHVSTLGHDLATAGTGAAVGALAGNQLAKRSARAGAMAGETTGPEAGAAAGETAGGPEAGAAAGGVEAGTAGGGTEAGALVAGSESAAEGDTFITIIEEGITWAIEHPWVLLESYKSKSPEQPWRALVRYPVYAMPAGIVRR
jgi:hypothetical protein